jgi:phage terminase large subunit
VVLRKAGGHGDGRVLAGVLETERRELISERGEEDGEAIFQQEYHDLVLGGLPGAYYAKIIDKLERDGRVTAVPHNPQPASSYGLGSGQQRRDGDLVRPAHGTGWAVIDYLANTSVEDRLLRRRAARQALYLRRAPDAARRGQRNHAGVGQGDGRNLGLKNIRVVPRTESVANDINEVRQILPLCWFDKEKTAPGLDALRSYRRVWDEKLHTYRDKPLHDWASDPADAFRTFAMGKPR